MLAPHWLIAVVAVSFFSSCGEEMVEREEVGQKEAELRALRFRQPRIKTKQQPAATYLLRTTDAYDPASEPIWLSSFPIGSTYTLYLAVDVPAGLAGHHQASVYLSTPTGAMYQRLDQAFATDVVAGAGEQQAQITPAGWRVWVSIPVAATAIEQLNLIGTWSAEVRIDSATAANASTAFSLN